jgi:hypothetical protein
MRDRDHNLLENIMDAFIVICFMFAIIGGIISGIQNMYTNTRDYDSKNIFTFFFSDKY